MIQLTRLNKHPLMVNSDLIQLVENAPDTVLTLVTGEKIVVLETGEQVLERIIEFRRRILSNLSLHILEAERAESAPEGNPVDSASVG